MTNRMRRLVLSFLVVTSVQLEAQESAQYLQNAIRDLTNLNNRQTLSRVGNSVPEDIPELLSTPAPTPVAERRIQSNKVPPLTLTKGELAALYQAAVSKGDTVNLKTGDTGYVHAAVHELEDSPSYNHEQTASSNHKDDTPGYYYYYYPIKSFLDEMTSQSAPDHHYSSPSHHEVHEVIPHPTDKPHYQFHTHTHEHNVKITKELEQKKEKKALEPLFMAISGFIGMAVMFVLSVLVFPKFGIKKSGRGGVKKNERITDIARVALQAIEGKDCAERFACELEKTARTFHLQDNRFVKLIKRMAPASFGKQMNKVGKYGPKRLRCTAIPCKKKSPPKKKTNAVVQKKH